MELEQYLSERLGESLKKLDNNEIDCFEATGFSFVKAELAKDIYSTKYDIWSNRGENLEEGYVLTVAHKNEKI